MNGRGSVWGKLVTAAIVTAGVGVVWGIAVGWMMSLGKSLTRHTIVHEQISITIDGTPVISVLSDDSTETNTLNRRTLDGKEWPTDYESWIYGVNLGRFELPPGVLQIPIRWTEHGARIGGVTDGKIPPNDWYIVSTDSTAAHLFLAGYDPLTKRSVGFIGTKGFRLVQPPLEEQFSFTTNRPGRVTQRVAIGQYIEPNRIVNYHDLYAYARPPQWLMFLMDGEQLWEVDLRERKLREIMEVPDVISLGLMTALESILTGEGQDDGAQQANAAESQPAATEKPTTTTRDSKATAANVPEEPPKTVTVLAVRTRDRVLLYDAMTGKQWEFKIPTMVSPDQPITAYWLDSDSLLLQYYAGGWSGGQIRQLVWVSPDGTIARQESVKLQDRVSPPESRRFWELAALMPEPLAWIGELLGVEPFWRLQYYRASTYGGALQQSLDLLWPMFLTVLFVSAVAAWYTRRIHRRYCRPHPGVWTVFVLLLGPPGLAAYWLEHRRAKVESCSHCGTAVPRDRDACAACDTPFPAPPLVGTEIFT